MQRSEVDLDPFHKKGQHGCKTTANLGVVRCATRCPCGGHDREALHFTYQLCPACIPMDLCMMRCSSMSCGVMSFGVAGDEKMTRTMYTFNLHGLVFCSTSNKIRCGLLGVTICTC